VRTVGRDGKNAGARSAQNGIFQNRSGPVAGRSGDGGAIASARVGQHRTEHQPVERGVLQPEAHISLTDEVEQRFRIVNSRRRACEAVVQPIEADGGNGARRSSFSGK
jgi:hypothetical protein